MKDLRDPEGKVLVAVVIAPHGINGAVSAESYSDNPRRFAPGAELTTAQGQVMRIVSASPHKGRLLLCLAGVSDRTAAEKLRGLRLYVDQSEVEPLPEGSWYWFQLLGLTVRDANGPLGEITDVLTYTANDVYVVRREDGRELLLPALRSVVKRVDIASGVMEVELPEGLEDEA
ncbi:MAG: 16S rRNA processing protein RimM [Firmicutes bacterium]|nr:16S rRNA processing protein RimM [Bacillota bacterium]